MGRTRAQAIAALPKQSTTTKRKATPPTQTDQSQTKKSKATNSLPSETANASNESCNIIVDYDPGLQHLDILTSEYSPTTTETHHQKPKRNARKTKRLISEDPLELIDESLTSSRIEEPTKKRKATNADVNSESCPNASISDISTMSETFISQINVGRTKNNGVKRKKAPRKPRKRPPKQQEVFEKLVLKFQRDASNNKGQCLIEDCRSAPMTWRPSNLKRHLKMMHESHYKNLFAEEVDAEKRMEIELFNVVQDAVEMVSINGLPFSTMNASGMRGFIDARLNTLKSSGYKLTLNRWNVVDEMNKVSKHIEDRLKAELKGKIIHLMLDIATNGTLSMLGVNASFSNEYEIKCPSLGIVKISERHNAVNLAELLYDEILSKYDVPLDYVFTMTTDNGKNVVNTATVLDMVANSCDTHVNPLYDETNQDVDANEAELLNLLNNNGIDYTAILNDIVEDVVQANDKIVLINQINCSTHTLQLAINDCMKESNAVAVLDEAKEICISLRLQIVQIEFNKLEGNKILPPLENSTRWNSRYLMVHSLLYKMCVLIDQIQTIICLSVRLFCFQIRGVVQIRNCIEKLAENAEFGEKFVVSDGFWEKANEIIDVLKIPYNATIESQKVGYGLSDFYITWLRMRKGLQRCSESEKLDLASKLMEQLDNRAPSLFDTPLMLCCIYLDPRINFKLSVSQKRDAALEIMNIYKRFDRLLSPKSDGVINDTLDEIRAEYVVEDSQQDISETTFINSLSQFETEKPTDIRASVMTFWKSHGHKYSTVAMVAEILHSIPANQCCVERSFSALSYLRSTHRKNTDAKTLRSALLIRLNKELFYDYRKEVVERIKNR